MQRRYKRLGLAALLLGLLVPIGVQAATDTESTVINANIASVISLTTSGTVNINVTPVTGGSQSSASDTVSVSTNHSAGYTLTLADDDANATLVNGVNTIAAHTGTQVTPTALANNSWGYAVASVGGFDSDYTPALDNETGSSSKWAGVPASGSPNTLKTTASTASGDATTVWYSVKADTTKPNGTYTDTVTYTATTN